MRILLVESGVTRPDHFVYQCYPPHGLMYLAAYLRQTQRQHTMKIYDMMVDRASPDDIYLMLTAFSPELVVIHAMTFQASCMHKIAQAVKVWNRNCVVAVGGPHPTIFPESTIVDKNIDIAAIGEGEDTFLTIVQRLESGGDLQGIPGTYINQSGQIIFGPKRAFIDNLDRLPFPAWDLIKPEKYFTDAVNNQNDITFRREVGTIMTSRACPYKCIFCHNMFGKIFRPRSVNNVLDEMGVLKHKYGIRELHIIDDCFNCNVERAIKIFQGVLERKFNFTIAFPNGIRGDNLPEELLSLMKKAGVYKINIGIESGSPRIQKMIKKNISLNIIKDTIKRVTAKGIFTHGFFMLGFPTETVKEINQTIAFACQSDLHTAGFALLTPFPGSEVYQIAMEQHKHIVFDNDETSFQLLTANLSKVDDAILKNRHKAAHRKFYANPRRLYRIAKALPKPMDLFTVGFKHIRLKML